MWIGNSIPNAIQNATLTGIAAAASGNNPAPALVIAAMHNATGNLVGGYQHQDVQAVSVQPVLTNATNATASGRSS